MSLLVAMLGASLAVGNVVQGAGELPAIWLEVQRGGRRLELVGDRHLEMNGAGRLTFRRDGRVIDLPPGATVLVDGRTASAKESVRLGQKVRVVDTEGRTLWSLASVPQAATLPEPVSFQAGPRFRVSVDPRIELLAIVQYLARYGLMNFGSDSLYRRNVDASFTGFSEHRAVTQFAEMYPKGFIFDIPEALMFYLSDPPALEVRLPIPETIVARAGGRRALEEFLQALRDFAAETNFTSFYHANRGSHEASLASVRDRVQSRDYIGILERYFGTTQPSYLLALVPLLQDIGFAARIERFDGRFDVFGVIGSGSAEAGVARFDSAEDTLEQLVWHEFGHSFVNPVTGAHRELVASYSALFVPVAEAMARKGYGTWETTLNEHVIRAVTARLAFREVGEDAGQAALSKEKGEGFPYVEALAERLVEYETNRERYPTFADFFPRLLEALEGVAGC